MRKVDKVWGFEEIWENTPKYCLKRLILHKGMKCSYHCHLKKEETLIVERGLVAFKVGEKEFAAGEEVAVKLGPGQYHKFGGLTDAALVEVSTHDDEADNERDPAELSGPMTAKGVSINMDDGTVLKLYHERLAGTI